MINMVDENHFKAMHRVMEYVAGTPSRGWILELEKKWYCKYKSFKFRIVGISDSYYAS